MGSTRHVIAAGCPHAESTTSSLASGLPTPGRAPGRRHFPREGEAHAQRGITRTAILLLGKDTSWHLLGLIDHFGNGIHRVVSDQRRRFPPMPDYDLSEPTEVKLTIHDAVIDEAYTRLMMVRTDLPLEDVLALDCMQKRLAITDDAALRLRRAKLIEGRKSRLHVSANVAAITGRRADYIRTKAQDDAHLSRLVLDYLEQFGSVSRHDLDELLERYLAEELTPQAAPR